MRATKYAYWPDACAGQAFLSTIFFFLPEMRASCMRCCPHRRSLLQQKTRVVEKMW